MRRLRDRLIVGGTIAGCIFAALITYAYVFGSTHLAIWRYRPQVGDLIFQSLPHSRLVDAIEGATGSPYSHCGIVGMYRDQWVVYEAYGEVEQTPLPKFLFRGRDQGFAAYRLTERYRHHIPAMMRSVQNYLGRPYDIHYEMDDEKIYCSELIYKAFADASGGERLGAPVKFGELNWQPYTETIDDIEPGAVPLDREIITPKDLAIADELELCFCFKIACSKSINTANEGSQEERITRTQQ